VSCCPNNWEAKTESHLELNAFLGAVELEKQLHAVKVVSALKSLQYLEKPNYDTQNKCVAKQNSEYLNLKLNGTKQRLWNFKAIWLNSGMREMLI
jgi:hypothetical protein